MSAVNPINSRSELQASEMFFIVGSGRCGTNMLRKMLVQHPAIRIMVETHFYPVLLDRFGTEPVSFSEFMDVVDEHLGSNGRRWIEVIVTIEGLDLKVFRDFVQQERTANPVRPIVGHVKALSRFLYGDGHYICGDKTPHYGLHVMELEQIFPDCKFIHLKRNGVFAARSMLSHPGFVKMINGLQSGILSITDIVRYHYRGELQRLSCTPVRIEQAADFWIRLISATEAALARISRDRVLEVRYEELLTDPRMSLARIAQFLGVEADLQWLARARHINYPLALRRMTFSLSRDEYLRIFEMLGQTVKDYSYTLADYDIYATQEVSVSDLRRLPGEWTQAMFQALQSRARVYVKRWLRSSQANQQPRIAK
jgi:Sulfotransferase family